MNEKINYQKKLDSLLEEVKASGHTPTLYLHTCCAPCSSYCLEYLTQYFKITVFYYNPNIYPEDEYYKRVKEQERFINIGNESLWKNKVDFVEGCYNTGTFYEAVKGLEQIPEGGERCFACYRMRLEEAARMAAQGGFDYYCTSLSISPHKNAQMINQIGNELAAWYGVAFLPSDFKKRNGFKRSTEISAEYGFYRQNYCGCVFSLKEAQKEGRI